MRRALELLRLPGEGALRLCHSDSSSPRFQSEAQVRLKEELSSPLRILQETARRIAKVSTESGIALIEDEYVQTFKVEMMDAVFQWCKGAKFAEICKVCLSTCQVTKADIDRWRIFSRARSSGVSDDCRS